MDAEKQCAGQVVYSPLSSLLKAIRANGFLKRIGVIGFLAVIMRGHLSFWLNVTEWVFLYQKEWYRGSIKLSSLAEMLRDEGFFYVPV